MNERCGVNTETGICGKPAVEHAILKGTDIKMYLCADHSDFREDIEAMEVIFMPVEPPKDIFND